MSKKRGIQLYNVRLEEKYPTKNVDKYDRAFNTVKRKEEQNQLSQYYIDSYKSAGKLQAGSTERFKQDFYNKADVNKYLDDVKGYNPNSFYSTGDKYDDALNYNRYLESQGYLDMDKFKLGSQLKPGAIWKLQNPDYKSTFLKGEERKKRDEAEYNKKQPKFDWSFLNDFKNVATNLGSAINPFDDVKAVDALANTSREFTEGTGKLLAPVSSNKTGSNMLKLMATLGSIPSTVGAGVAEYYDKNYDTKALDKGFLNANIETIKNLPGALASGAKNYVKSIDNLWNGDGKLNDFTNLTERKADEAVAKLKATGQYTKAKEKDIRNKALLVGNVGDFTTDFATGAVVGGAGIGDMLRGSGKTTSKLSSGAKKTQLDNLGKYVDDGSKNIIRDATEREIKNLNKKGHNISSSRVEQLANIITDEINTKRKVRTGNGAIGESIRKVSDKTIAPYVNRALYELSDRLNLKGTRQFKESLNYEKYIGDYLGKKISNKDLDIKSAYDKITNAMTVDQVKALNGMNPDEAQLFLDYITGKLNDKAVEFSNIASKYGFDVSPNTSKLDEVASTIDDNIPIPLKNRRTGNKDLKQELGDDKFTARSLQSLYDKLDEKRKVSPTVRNRRTSNKVNNIINQIKKTDLTDEDEFVESMFEQINKTKRDFTGQGNIVDDYFENIKDIGEVRKEFTEEGWSQLIKTKNSLIREIRSKSKYLTDEQKEILKYVEKERRNLFRQKDATEKGTTGYYKDSGKKIARWYMEEPRYKKLVAKENELIEIYKGIVDENRAKYKEHISKLTDEEVKTKLNQLLNKTAKGEKVNSYFIKQLKEELINRTKAEEVVPGKLTNPNTRAFPYQKSFNSKNVESLVKTINMQKMKYKVDADFLENLHNKNPEMIKKLKDGRYLYEDKEAGFRKILKPGDKINYANYEELTKIPVMQKRYKDITKDPAYYDIISELERFNEIKNNSQDYDLYKNYMDTQEKLLDKTPFDDTDSLEHKLNNIESQMVGDKSVENLSKKYKDIHVQNNAPDEKTVYKVKIKSDKVRTIREKIYKAKYYYDKSTFNGDNFDSMQRIGTPEYVMPYQIKKNMIDFVNKYPEQFSILTKKKLDEYLDARSKVRAKTDAGISVKSEMFNMFKTQGELLERIYEETTKGKPIQSIKDDLLDKFEVNPEDVKNHTIDNIISKNGTITEDVISQLNALFPDDFVKRNDGSLVKKDTGEIFEVNEVLDGNKLGSLRTLKPNDNVEYINEALDYMKKTRVDFDNVRPEVTQALLKFNAELKTILSEEMKHGVINETSYHKYVGNQIGKILFKQEINTNDIKRLKKHFITEKYGFGTKDHNYKGLINEEAFEKNLLELFDNPETIGTKLSELLASRYKISEDAIYDKIATNNLMELVGYSPNSKNIPKNAKPYINIGDVKKVIDDKVDLMKHKIKVIEDKIKEAEKVGDNTSAYREQLKKIAITTPDMSKQQVYDAMNNLRRKIAKEEFGLDWDKDLDELVTPLLDLSVKGREHLVERYKNDSSLTMKYISDDNVKFWNLERQKSISDNANIINKIYTEYLTDFKTVVTSYNPAWHSKNFIQNYIHGFIQEGMAMLNPKNRTISKELTNQIMGDTDYLGMTFKRKKGKEGTTIIDAKGREWSYYDLKKAIEESGLVESGLFGTELKNKQYKDLEGSAKVKSIYQDFIRPSGEKSIWSFGGLHNKSRQEAFSRVQIVLSALDNGKSLPEAIKSSEKALFNYNDVSMFEYNTLRKLVPFYSFMKNNIPFQITNMLNQPWKYQAMQRPLDYIDDYSQLNSEYQNEDLDNTYHKIRLPFEKNIDLVDKKGRPYKQQVSLYANNLVPNINNVMKSDVMSDLTPPLQTAMQLLQDKDYFGNKIHNGDSKKGLEYFFNQVSPITKENGKALPKTWDKWFTNVERTNQKGKEHNKVSEILRLINPVSSKYYRVYE